MTTIKQISKIIGVTNLARFMKVSNEMVNKSIRKGYAPADWYHKLVSITGVTYEELYTDLYLNKHHCKPEVVKEQVAKYLNSVGKKPTKGAK